MKSFQVLRNPSFTLNLINTMISRIFQILFVMAWLIDTVATTIFVSVGGVELEANPVMNWLIRTHGVDTFIYTKLIILIVWNLLQFSNKFKWQYNMILCAILIPVAIMGIIVAVNIS